MATINPGQDYDIIHTLTFSSASGTCPIRLHRGSSAAYSGTVYYRAGTSGSWTTLSVSGTATTFPVTNTTMQVAHNWNKSGNNYMTPSFRDSANLLGIAISQKAVLSGVMGNSLMYGYARDCTSLTSLDVPDTSNLTSVGNSFMGSYARGCSSLTSLSAPDTSNVTSVGTNFMYYYARDCTSLTSLPVPDTSNLTSVGVSFMFSYAANCTSLTRLELPKVGWFEANNVDWSVPAARLGILKGYVTNNTDLTDWQSLTVSGKTLHTNYIQSTIDVVQIGMAISVFEDFNTLTDGNLNGQNGWVNASQPTAAQVQTSVVFEGPKALSISNSFTDVTKAFTPISDHYILSFYIRVPSLPLFGLAGGVRVQGGGDNVQLILDSSGNVILANTTMTTTVSVGSYTTNLWYRMDMEINHSTQEVRARINGGSWSSVFSGSTMGYTTLSIVLNDGTITYFDYIVIENLVPPFNPALGRRRLLV